NTVNYKDKNLLEFTQPGLPGQTSITFNNGAITGRNGAAVDILAFTGDADGSHTYSGQDGFLIGQLAIGQTAGFAAYKNLDPKIIAAVDQRGSPTAKDKSLMGKRVIGSGVPLAPAPPAETPAGTSAADPRLFFTNYSNTPGSTFTVAVN